MATLAPDKDIDMPIALDMMSCPNLAMPMDIMQHVVNVESASNPFAIGVVGARLERQPSNLPEALATVRMLEDQGYNFSLGVAQVNRYNLAKYGLSSYEQAFDTCANLSAGARILSECHSRAGGDWGKSFSCYYSGNLSKGFEDGYVQKVFDSMRNAAQAVPPRITSTAAFARTSPGEQRKPGSVKRSGLSASQYRTYMRSSIADAIGNALVPQVLQGTAPGLPHDAVIEASAAAPDSEARTSLPNPVASANGQDVFVPQISRPDGGPLQEKPDHPSTKSAKDQADLRLGSRDEAFVF